MRIVIAGGHGKIALALGKLLGGQAVSLIRNPDHTADVQATGASAVVCDLEKASDKEVADVLKGADAAVFAAGAGPNSGIARKDSVDRGASVLLAEACEAAGVPRFVQISSMGAGEPPAPGTDEVWAAYITAKTAAEEDLRRRPLAWTILRPGRLTDDPPTGRVLLGPPGIGQGSIPRADVAAVIAAILETGAGTRATWELIGGDVPIMEAIKQ